MSRTLFLASAVLALSTAMAFSAGPFDGTYQGGSGKTCGLPPTTVTLTVVGSVVTGTSAWSNGSVPIRGKVDPDGTFQGTIASERFSGKFQGTKFEASYTSSGAGSNASSEGCKRVIELERKG
ncbi:MAG TPA: hypothetical protein VEK12_08685 [Alphaproteobacteria bacterium]|nr:hypothetical protein [Alphaproteobacteria bacterium]